MWLLRGSAHQSPSSMVLPSRLRKTILVVYPWAEGYSLRACFPTCNVEIVT